MSSRARPVPGTGRVRNGRRRGRARRAARRGRAPVFALTATTSASGTSSRASSSASSSVSSSTASAFVTATTPCCDAEQAEDRKVLVRLGPRALGGVDREQEEVDAGGARDHVAHEPLVTGHVDERERAPVGQLERRVAEVDRDAALPAPRAAGRCPSRSAPARATSCRGRCAPRCRPSAASRAPAARDLVGLGVASSVRQSSSRRPSRTTPTTGGSPSRAAAPRAPPRPRRRTTRHLRQRQRTAADPGDRLLDLAAHRDREPAGPRAHERSVLLEHPQHGQLRERPRRVEVEPKRALERSERQLVRPAAPAAADGGAAARPGRRGLRRSPPAGRRAACRRRSRRGRRRARGSPSRTARRRYAASTPEPRSSTSGSACRRATAASSSRRGSSVKPTTRKFDWWTRRIAPVSGPIARS